MTTEIRVTYRPKSYGSSCQSDKASIPGVWLMDLVCVVVAELADYPLYPLMIACGKAFPYEVLEV